MNINICLDWIPCTICPPIFATNLYPAISFDSLPRYPQLCYSFCQLQNYKSAHLIIYIYHKQRSPNTNSCGRRPAVRITPPFHYLLTSMAKAVLNPIYQVTVDPLWLLNQPTRRDLVNCFTKVCVSNVPCPTLINHFCHVLKKKLN